MNNDLISREALKKKFERLVDETIPYGEVAVNDMRELIDNAPTVFDDKAYSDGYTQGTCDCEHAHERPQGECKTCKYYHPYFKQFSNEPRGDGYCVIARMTPEGMTTINCNDEFGCSDYQKGGAE